MIGGPPSTDWRARKRQAGRSVTTITREQDSTAVRRARDVIAASSPTKADRSPFRHHLAHSNIAVSPPHRRGDGIVYVFTAHASPPQCRSAKLLARCKWHSQSGRRASFGGVGTTDPQSRVSHYGVFVQIDAVGQPFQPRYEGPSLVGRRRYRGATRPAVHHGVDFHRPTQTSIVRRTGESRTCRPSNVYTQSNRISHCSLCCCVLFVTDRRPVHAANSRY